MNRNWIYAGLMAAGLALLVAGPCLAADECTEIYGAGGTKIGLATGSPGSLGLVKALAEAFNAKNNSAICWRKAGSGASLTLLRDKKVDLVMVHAPAAEKKAVEEGWAADRTLIGSNEFYIVGPKEDPANISDAKTVAEAYKRIAAARAKFFSRGDNSGTHKKEKEIWEKAAVTPEGAWYIVTKDFMTATLRRADKETGYFMTDSSTWIAEKKHLSGLVILFKGDPFLVNTYHALTVPPGATQGSKLASEFVKFVASEEGQRIVRDYGKDKHGEGLYNDAQYAQKYDK
ncbi:MAG: substrate-binding domain-containing protein [Thermodesulfobacteriota bacterium]